MRSTLLFIILFPLAAMAQKQGQQNIDSLLQELPKQKEDTNKVNLLTVLSHDYGSIDPSEGMKYGQAGLRLARELNYKAGIGWAYNALGANCYFLSDYPASLDYYLKSLEINEELNDKRGIAITTGNVGNVYEHLGNSASTLKYYFKAMGAYGDIHDTNGVARMEGNIGLVYMNEGNYTMALDYDMRALKAYQKLKYKNITANVYENIATVYQLQSIYDKALENHFKALAISREIGDKNLIAVCHGNIGECYLAMAKDTTSTVADPGGQLSKAKDYLTKAVDLCDQTKFLGPMQEFLQKLSEAQTLSGNYEAALNSYKQFVSIKDSIFSSSNKIKIANLETKRELELKDKQIELDKLAVEKKRNERGFFIAGIILMLGIIVIIFRSYKVVVAQKKKVEERTKELNATNQELNVTLVDLKEAQDQLVVTEKQKENEMIRSRIAMDIHDDVSSELTRISWLSELAKLKFKKSDVGEVGTLLDKITSSSRQTIGKLGEIIWTVNPQNDNIENLISHIRNFTSRFFTDTAFEHSIDFPEQMPNLQISPELKRNLFLVVKEALNNAVKYSQASHIEVSFHLTEHNGYVLVVGDNGRGIDENIIQGGGNGLRNMRSRMKEINGSCTIQPAPGAGTQVTFEGILY